MNRSKRLLSILLTLVFVLVGCAGSNQSRPSATDEPMPSMEEQQEVGEMEPGQEDDSMMDDDHQGEMMEEPQDEAMSPTEEGSGSMEDHKEGEMMAEDSDEAMMERPAYFSAELVNARTGEAFTLADYQGKVILVETLAMWCSNCKRQQEQVKELHALLGEREDFISLGLDIDPNENREALKTYTEKNGFDWLYAVAPAEVSSEISSLYGAQFLNPPSTPMFIIDRHGEVHPLPFGIKDAAELQNALQPFLDEGM